MYIWWISFYFINIVLIINFFEKNKELISNLDVQNAITFDKADNLIVYLKNNLSYNSANCCFLVHTIKQLEIQNMPLSESLCIV